MIKAQQKTTKPDNQIQEALIENFITLQKVMTNLSVKFDNLSDQIAKLLDLFEISAKAMAEKNFEFDDGREIKKATENRAGYILGGELIQETEELTQKLDELLEQNKIIARGFILMNEKIEELTNNEQVRKDNKNFLGLGGLEQERNGEENTNLRESRFEKFKPREYY